MDLNNLCMGCMSEKTDDSSVCSVCGWQHDGPVDTSLYLKPGTVINNYVFGKVLGHGGFGITYLGKNTTTNEVVAIKEYFPGGNISRSETHQELSVFQGKQEEYNYGLEKFRIEADMIQKFNDFPGIVDGKDFFEANNTGYFVMEYIEGVTLKDYVELKGGSLPFKSVKAIIIPMMDSLEEMHKNKIIHRDISPDNIYITKDKRVKLLDFGAARQAIGEKNKSLSIILKHGFAPKEQYYTKGNQGPWTDVYALAATSYYMLTGKTPQSSLERVEKDEIIMPSRLGADISFEEERVLMTALSLKENERYQTMRNFQTAIVRAENSNNQGSGQSMFPQEAMSGQPQQAPVMQPSNQQSQNNQPQQGPVMQPFNQQVNEQGYGAQQQNPPMNQPMNQGGYSSQASQPQGTPQGYNSLPQQGQQAYQQSAGNGGAKPKKSKAPVVILVLLMVLVLAGGVTAALYFTVFSKVEMPEIEGLTLEEAKDELDDADINYKIDDSEDTDEDVESGEIISQSPKEGTKVSKNDKIDIEVVVSLGPPSISLPSFASMVESDAVDSIEELGLEKGDVSYEYSEAVPADGVISQFPVAGEEADNGSEVSLVVSLGPKPVQNIPIADTGTKDAIITSLNIAGDEITDEDVENTTYLDLSDKGLVDISDLAYFVNLETLDLSDNSIVDISPLAELNNLTVLYLDNNEIDEIEAFAPNLEFLSIECNYIHEFPDMSGHTNLESINAYDNYLDVLPGLPSSLIYADFSLSFIEDISSLNAGVPNLQYLYLDFNDLIDISPLATCTSLIELDLSYNEISDFSAIAAIYDNLDYYDDEENYGSYLGGPDEYDISEVLEAYDDFSDEIIWFDYGTLTDSSSYYYIGDLIYVDQYVFFGEALDAYALEEDGAFIATYFDTYNYCQGYYLEYEGIVTGLGGTTVDELADVLGTPVADTGWAVVYYTDWYIYEFIYDDYGNLTDGFYSFDRTATRESYF